ncbi:MAG: type IV pilus modification PilV family protein [Acidiferrobacteraceae bacterium]
MTPPKERGFLLIAAIVLLVILSFFALIVTALFVGDTRRSIDHLSSAQALFLAESGLERATRTLLSPTVMTPSSTDNRLSCQTVNTNLTGVAQGAGVFSVTGGTPFYSGDTVNTPMTVNGPLSATATVIPLANTASLGDYAPAGRVLIDTEAIDYSAISPSAAVCGGTSPCLIGVARGVDGTLPAAHASGTPVAQYQCVVQSKGDVPSVASPRGQRTLTQGIQLQEAWAVGSEGMSWQTGGPVTTLLRWTGSTWTDASPSITSRNLNAISCINYADCWAVGSANFMKLTVGGGPGPAATVAHWNGSSWTDFSGTLPGSIRGVDFDAVTCVSHDDCWMVGGYTKGQWLLVHMAWSAPNTPAWTVYPWLSGQYKKYDIDSVACVNANLCWAVGSLRKAQTLLLEWNGAGWSNQTALLPANGPIRANNLDLDAITCLPTDCWAVGSFQNDRPSRQAAIAHWSAGTGWQDQSNEVAGSLDVEFVGCADASECWATGSVNENSVTELLYWNGTIWSDVSSTIPTAISQTFEDIDGIACGAPNDCWIVGSIWGPYLTGTNGLVALHWDGTAWTNFSGSLPNGNDVEGIALTGPGPHPRAAWQEVFP